MRRIALLAVLIFSLSILAGCGGDELPPPPPPPGQIGYAGGAIAGMAGALPTWASSPINVAVTPPQAYFGDGVVLSASQFDYIYKNGYVFNSKTRVWERFNLQGEQVEDWVKGQAIGSIPVDDSRFTEGENYAVIYACSKIGSKWECNNRKWMLVSFDVKGSATGAIPELANLDDFVINSPIRPFAIMGATAEQDNFAEINVIRYDARYREPQGLVVLVHVFDFNERAELDKTIRTMFAPIIQNGMKRHSGHNVALFLDETDHRVAVWTSGKQIVYVETFAADSANKEIIDEYLKKYPSDLKQI